MLRSLLGAAETGPGRPAGDALTAMERYLKLLEKLIRASGDGSRRLRTYEIWTKGLMVALEELEESRFAARLFGERVTAIVVSGLSEDELLNYRRYVYFDKNAYIRLFALLDKLGTLMNDMLQLQTEKLKPQFSYYTVLRGMRERGLHRQLSDELNRLKETYREPMNLLRKRRNMEVHYMNAELEDDLTQLYRAYGSEVKLENIAEQMNMLDLGLRMATDSVKLAFDYAARVMSKSR